MFFVESTEMVQRLLADLTPICKKIDPQFNQEALRSTIIGAIREVREARGYSVIRHTQQYVDADLFNYYSNIRGIALYDYEKQGGFSQKSHRESDIDITYRDRDDCFRGVCKIARIK